MSIFWTGEPESGVRESFLELPPEVKDELIGLFASMEAETIDEEWEEQ